MAGILKVDRVQSDSNLAFQIGSSNVAYFDVTDGIKLGTTKVGTSLITTNGIAFPDSAVSSSDANTLDDYEEGTWTAYLSDGTNSASLGTFKYTKVGNTVVVRFGVYNASMTSLSGATHLRLTGLPFTVNSSYSSDALLVGSLTSNNPILLNLTGGQTYGLLYQGTVAGVGVNALVKGDFGSTTNCSLWGNFTYFTN